MTAFAGRNLKVFFRDRAMVFFSLLASLIIIALYILFLGDAQASNFDRLPNARELLDNWMMAGLLATTSVSSTMGAFSILVSDKTRKISKDFYASPLGRIQLMGGYIASALLIGLILSLLTFAVAEAYIVFQGGSFLSGLAYVKTIGILLLAVLSNGAMTFFFSSLFESENAFSTASTVIGTLVGFLTGIYLPIGMLPEAVQWAIKLFPTSHAAAALRQVMMETPMAVSLEQVPPAYIAEFKHTLGVSFAYGSRDLPLTGNILILIAYTALFFILAAWRFSRKKRS